ncbi:MAG: 1,2-phenylacetyl-CoA epoxidase subunit PaaC [Chitinophagaceae bacterium]
MMPLSTEIAEMMIKMADDALIMGHRNSEWTGLGPILEEDIAFSSMSQDQIGHSLALYQILQEGEKIRDPDSFAFLRNEKEYRCCHLVEMPNDTYAFSLMRHFLFDYAQAIRYEYLESSSFEPLRNLSKKFKGELKYHTFHARAWITQLGQANEESHHRMELALKEAFSLALGIFEPGPSEEVLTGSGIYPGEKFLQQHWLDRIYPILSSGSLNLPDVPQPTAVYGGRQGIHTPYLAPLLLEMGEVFQLDPITSW